MSTKKRYLVPNAFTALSVLFALLAIMTAVQGNHMMGAWFCLFCVLCDKLDGFAARALHAESDFGVQFDSFADFLAFGIAPATVIFSYLTSREVFGFTGGLPLLALQVSLGVYVLGVATRLARFNVDTGMGLQGIFFGVPTTVCGGVLMSLFLAFLKYGDPAVLGYGPFDDFKILGEAHSSVAMWQAFPIYLLIGAVLMHVPLKVPKLKLTKSPVLNAVLLINVAGVYGFGAARMLPEYFAMVGIGYVLMSVAWGFSPAARALHRPTVLGGHAAALLASDGSEEDESAG